MSNEKYNAAAAGLTLAAIDGAQMTIESLRKDREYVITLLAAAQQEIASLKVRVWQCGAGAGCCAQAARIKELEAQLEAVGADPDDEAVPANAAESYTQRVIEALYENGDPVSADAAEELQRLAAQLEAVGAGKPCAK